MSAALVRVHFIFFTFGDSKVAMVAVDQGSNLQIDSDQPSQLHRWLSAFDAQLGD
mgnify:CR=1 FL=1